MLHPQTVRMTEEEYEAWDMGETRAEFVDGVVEFMVAEGLRADSLGNFLRRLVALFAEVHHLGEVHGPMYAARLRVGLRRLPDLMFIRNDHQSDLTRTYYEGGPDLTMEVVSPDDWRRDWITKRKEYEAYGVREYWIIDPEKRKVEVNVLDDIGAYRRLEPHDGAWPSTVLAGFYLREDWLWSERPPPTLEIAAELGLFDER